MRLHGYFRSTAAWRVRIALNLKGIPGRARLPPSAPWRATDAGVRSAQPQGLVPALETDDGAVLTQSLAICEWLDETHPTPPLLPGGALDRARVRAFALAVACDTHPVQNLRVLARLRAMPEPEVTGWARWVIEDGLGACEALLANTPGPFCFGTNIGGCLPCAAALQWAPLRLRPVAVLAAAAEKACAALPAFADAAPERQGDGVTQGCAQMERKSHVSFASTKDLADKNISFEELGPGLYGYTAEGDPNSGVVIGDESVLVVDAQATPRWPRMSSRASGR